MTPETLIDETPIDITLIYRDLRTVELKVPRRLIEASETILYHGSTFVHVTSSFTTSTVDRNKETFREVIVIFVG